MWELSKTFLQEIKEQNVKGFTDRTSKRDFFGTNPTFYFGFSPTQLNFLSLNVLFVNEKTALISTNDFIVFYKV